MYYNYLLLIGVPCIGSDGNVWGNSSEIASMGDKIDRKIIKLAVDAIVVRVRRENKVIRTINRIIVRNG